MIALVSAFSTVFAVRQRYKRSTGEERQRMRWIAYVALAGRLLLRTPVDPGVHLRVPRLDDDAPVFEFLFGATALTLAVGIPTAYLIAIFRYGLWDLDVVVKKTVQYGFLVAGFTIVVGLVILLAPLALVGVAAASTLRSIAIAVLLAIGFTLVRTRARRWANRVVYGKRATPYEVLSEFGERVGETYSTEDVLPRMAQLLGEASGARTATVWLRIGDEMRVEASWPPGVTIPPDVPVRAEELPEFGDEEAFEVKHQGELLGALTVSSGRERSDEPDEGEARSGTWRRRRAWCCATSA